MFNVLQRACELDYCLLNANITCMIEFARRYVTSDDVLELKGKVACEISSADELTLTELMFNGVLKDVKVEEVVSLLSCFVWQEKLQDASKPREELDLLFVRLQDIARRVANVQLECKVQTKSPPNTLAV